LKQASAQESESDGAEEEQGFPTSIVISATESAKNCLGYELRTGVAKLQFPKINPEARSVQGSGKIEGTAEMQHSNPCVSWKGETRFTSDASVRLEKSRSSESIKIILSAINLNPPEYPIKYYDGDPEDCFVPYPLYTTRTGGVLSGFGADILPPRKGTIDPLGGFTLKWEIVSVTYGEPPFPCPL
jgi:hypothetical protein